MLSVSIIVLLFIFVFSSCVLRSILHPATITSVLWFFLIVIYNYVEHPLFELSLSFYKALLIWVVPFCLVSIVFGKINFPCFSFLKNKYCNDVFLDKFYFPILFSLISLIALFYVQSSFIGGGNIISNYRAYAMDSLFDDKTALEGMLLYSLNVSVVIILARLFYSKNVNRKKWIILFAILLFVFVIKAEKFNFIMLSLFVFCLLIKRRKFFWLFFFAILAFFLLICLSVIRADRSFYDYDYLSFIQIYLLSPMAAFDSVLTGDMIVKSDIFGEFTFNAFTRLFYGNNNDLFSLERWAYVPLPTNVYTIMFDYYVDFGYCGILFFSIFMGAFFGYFYSFYRRNISCFCLLYPFLFFLLVIQFFHNALSLFFFKWIQYVMLSIFCFLKYSNKSLK